MLACLSEPASWPATTTSPSNRARSPSLGMVAVSAQEKAFCKHQCCQAAHADNSTKEHTLLQCFPQQLIYSKYNITGCSHFHCVQKATLRLLCLATFLVSLATLCGMPHGACIPEPACSSENYLNPLCFDTN